MKVVETMGKVPFSSVEDQLEARGRWFLLHRPYECSRTCAPSYSLIGVVGLSIGEFKEGATIAYHQIAEKYAAAGECTMFCVVVSELSSFPVSCTAVVQAFSARRRCCND